MKNQENKTNANIFPKMEEEVLEFWDRAGIFKKSLEKDAPKGDYTFYDGPPFATGTPHYGHLVGTIMKDVVPRYWTMKGYKVPRRWGWDCHGLPVENLAEKELGLSNKQDIEAMGVEKFNAYCESIVLRYANDWKKTIRRIGRWVDMENDYKTMDPEFMESIWWVFKTLWDKGLIYKGHKAMHICPRCGTTLSNFEVTQGYKDIKDLSAVVKFKVKSPTLPNLLSVRGGMDDGGEDLFILAWTTTPWTLIGNVGLAAGKGIKYQILSIKGMEGGYILAKERVEYILKDKEYQVVSEMDGGELIGLEYEALFDYYHKDEKLENRENGWRVYGGDFVTTEEGTGIVHIAPAFGEDDMNLGREHKLPFVQHVDGNGKFKEEVKDFAGLEVKPKADHMATDIEIIKYLAHNNLLFHKEKYEHSYPHCWRCETPLLNYASESWFVEVTKIRADLQKNNQQTSWIPAHVKDGRFGKWLEQARDWAISRNRYWGAPLPVWECEECDETEVIGNRADLKGKLGYFYILRHGEAQSNVDDILSASINDGKFLTETGVRQIEEAAEKLKDEKIELIISSDLDRTKQTAGIVAEKLGIEIIYDERLRETNVGECEGRKMEGEVEEIMARRRLGEDISFPGGECWSELGKRAKNFYEDMLVKYPGKKILIVSHGDLLASLNAILTGDDFLEEIRKIHIEGYIQKGELAKREYVLTNLHKQYADKIFWPCRKCGGNMKRIPEVLDCWFESGSMPYAQMNYLGSPLADFDPLAGKNFPAEFIAEGMDQTRGWFYTLMVLSSALFDKPAFLNVIVNGIVLAEDGQKMSKSKQNYPDPSMLFNEYSVDAIRYYLLSSPVVAGENLNFAEAGVREVLRKVEMLLWNVYKFYSMYENNANLRIDANAANSNNANLRMNANDANKGGNVLDGWILARLDELVREVEVNMDNYNLPKAVRPIGDFIDDLSTWYLRRSRERFKGDDEKDREAALRTTGYVLMELSKVIAPFMPFLAEQIWQKVSGFDFNDDDRSVHLDSWPSRAKVSESKTLIEEMRKARRIVEMGLAKRDEAAIKVRQPLSRLMIKSLKFKIGEDYLGLIKDEVNVRGVEFVDGGNDLEVDLDTEISEELKWEGLKRELIRTINNGRKNQGLTRNDKIEIFWQADGELKKAIEMFIDELKKDTLTSDFIEKKDLDGQKVKVNGEEMIFIINKIN
jgi:isoleucyl-tRNA synthetase